MERNLDGYRFSCDEDAEMASNELQKINMISSKLSANNPDNVLIVYNKCIQNNIFTTPVGIDYLKSLQSYLKKCESINQDDVMDIPIRISYADALELKANNRYKDIDARVEKNYVKEFRFSLFFNIILVAMVIAMFFIALKADNPNILNYQNAITNEYADWQQELEKKDVELRQREQQIKAVEESQMITK